MVTVRIEVIEMTQIPSMQGRWRIKQSQADRQGRIRWELYVTSVSAEGEGTDLHIADLDIVTHDDAMNVANTLGAALELRRAAETLILTRDSWDHTPDGADPTNINFQMFEWAWIE